MQRLAYHRGLVCKVVWDIHGTHCVAGHVASRSLHAMTRTQGSVRGWTSADMHAWSCDGSHLAEALRVVQGDEGGN